MALENLLFKLRTLFLFPILDSAFGADVIVREDSPLLPFCFVPVTTKLLSYYYCKDF